MSIVQWCEQVAKNIEKFVFGGVLFHLLPVDLALFVPIDIPEFKERIAIGKSLPQIFEEFFCVMHQIA